MSYREILHGRLDIQYSRARWAAGPSLISRAKALARLGRAEYKLLEAFCEHTQVLQSKSLSTTALLTQAILMSTPGSFMEHACLSYPLSYTLEIDASDPEAPSIWCEISEIQCL